MITLKELQSTAQCTTSAVPQGSVLGSLLFNIFFGGMNCGIECTLDESAVDTKLHSAINYVEGKDITLRDLFRLERDMQTSSGSTGPSMSSCTWNRNTG